MVNKYNLGAVLVLGKTMVTNSFMVAVSLNCFMTDFSPRYAQVANIKTVYHTYAHKPVILYHTYAQTSNIIPYLST